MNLEYSTRIPAPPDRVFAALQDPETVRRCIDGCESMTPIGENLYEIRAKGGIKGTVHQTAAQPPESITLAIEGKTLAGSLKATVHLHLMAHDGGTQLTGNGEVIVGGFLKALGSKLLESQARAALADFFAKLSAQLTTSGT